MRTYEIYTYNDKPIDFGCYAGSAIGEVSGWDIKLVATNDDIRLYPLFDCVITINDFTLDDCEHWRQHTR